MANSKKNGLNLEPDMIEHTREVVIPHVLPILPLKNIVTLPGSIVPVIVGRASSIQAVEYAIKNTNKIMFVTAQKHPDTEDPTIQDLFAHGTVCSIMQIIKMPNGSLKILIEGLQRSKVAELEDNQNFILATCDVVPTAHKTTDTELEAAWRQLDTIYQQYIKFNQKIPVDMTSMARTFRDKDTITDTIAVHANMSFDDRQKFLEIEDLTAKMIELAILLK